MGLMKKHYPSVAAIYAILFLDSLCFGLSFLILPSLFLQSQIDLLPLNTLESTRNLFLGFSFALFPLAQFFGAPFFGKLSDRWGRKPIFYCILFGSFTGYIFTTLSLTYSLFSCFLISRIFCGFFASHFPLGIASLIDSSSEGKQRLKNFSLLIFFVGISWICVFLLRFYGRITQPIWIFWFISACSLLSLFLLHFFYQETIQKKSTSSKGLFYEVSKILEEKPLSLLYLLFFFWGLGFFLSLEWIFPFSIEKFSLAEAVIPKLFIAFALLWSLTALIINYFLEKKCSSWVIGFWMLFLMSLFYFFMGSSNYFLYFAITYVLSGGVAALVWIHLLKITSSYIPPSATGITLGVAQAVLSLAHFLGLFFGGLIAGSSLEGLFYFCAVSIFCSFFLLSVIRIRWQNA